MKDENNQRQNYKNRKKQKYTKLINYQPRKNKTAEKDQKGQKRKSQKTTKKQKIQKKHCRPKFFQLPCCRFFVFVFFYVERF